MKTTTRKITDKTILKRAEELYNVLKVLHGKDNKKMHKDDFMKLMVKLSSGRQLYASLIRHNIISGTKRGSKERFVHYCGIEPNIVAAKKIVEDVIELGRQWNKAHQERYADKRGVAKGTATVSVQHSKDTVVDKEPAKLTPLHYNSFLKEIAILKERYALTVPNAHIEINVRVPSNTTV